MCPWGYALFFADEIEVHSFNDVSTLPENFKIDWSQVKAHFGSHSVQFKIPSLSFEGVFEGVFDKASMNLEAMVSTSAESTEMALAIFSADFATPPFQLIIGILLKEKDYLVGIIGIRAVEG